VRYFTNTLILFWFLVFTSLIPPPLMYQGKVLDFALISTLRRDNSWDNSGRCGGLMVSALVPGASGPGSSPGHWPGTLCCVFGQDT